MKYEEYRSLITNLTQEELLDIINMGKNLYNERERAIRNKKKRELKHELCEVVKKIQDSNFNIHILNNSTPDYLCTLKPADEVFIEIEEK